MCVCVCVLVGMESTPLTQLFLTCIFAAVHGSKKGLHSCHNRETPLKLLLWCCITLCWWCFFPGMLSNQPLCYYFIVQNFDCLFPPKKKRLLLYDVTVLLRWGHCLVTVRRTEGIFILIWMLWRGFNVSQLALYAYEVCLLPF